MKRTEEKMVTVVIDDEEYQMPEGMNLVDAAKAYADNDIPVFCYHPKLGNAGNCRMCLVELGSPRPNRETGDMELAWFPTLQTACTHHVSDGLHLRTTSKWVQDGRREILEFLLSSHPLDCPICDKGGECPLQNLTMRHGPGTSRMYWDDKMRLGKHIPLGEIIYLDQERCIHCARCIRFQEAIVDDPVLSFDLRGRRQQIITSSDPGFDSQWSGNTTDICPVGALTTEDFRFNARPWEMRAVGSLDTHTPEGANIIFDIRPAREKQGQNAIKRIMPRQNEFVNEIWISDKTRFVRHYMDHPDRLTRPLVRKGGTLQEATWAEALDLIAAKLRDAGDSLAAIGGPRLSNEDFYALQELIRGQGSHNLSVYPARMAGAELVAQVGVATETNLRDMQSGDAILVVASDLHQEAPIWWLRVKEATERGAALILITGRETRLDTFATHIIRTPYGGEVEALEALNGGEGDAARTFAEAENAIAFVGGEGFAVQVSQNVAQAAANLLIDTGHVGRPDNGLIMVWPGANIQGGFDMGFSHAFGPGYAPIEAEGLDYANILKAVEQGSLDVLILAGADLAFDDHHAEEVLTNTDTFIVATAMFLTRTAELADVVLPTQSVAEREGTYTNGERRVQRFYQAIEPIGFELFEEGGGTRPDWRIARQLAEKLGGERGEMAATQVFSKIAKAVPQYEGMTHARLSRTPKQFPDVGGDDLYYGGTSYNNEHGVGIQWAVTSEQGEAPASVAVQSGDALSAEGDRLVIVPVTSLYDREHLFTYTDILDERIPEPYAALNPATAEALGVGAGDALNVAFNGHDVTVHARIEPGVPEGLAVVPRRLQPQGAPQAATLAPITRLEKAEA
jgi:NADH-quinone oxidoreductase subunit G